MTAAASRTARHRALSRKCAHDLIVQKWLIDVDCRRLLKKFYAILRKHGVKQGEWMKNGRGRTCNNPEWTAAKALFESQVRGQLEMWALFNDAPSDLLA